MSTSPDVSVIIPVYNAEEYIERCLDSVVGQTLGLDRMQVLVVDDGSTDSSPALIDAFAKAHPAFEVIRRPVASGGPATPRNLALERVRGRYVFFLDQDDYLSADALETMIGTADHNHTDIVLARMKGTGGRNTPRPMFTRTIPRTDVFSTPSIYWVLNPIKLFRTDLVRRLGVGMRPDFQLGEDLEFVATAYFKADGISIIADKDYIFWVNREDSSNITLSAVALSERLPAASHMVDLVAAAVPPGPARDALMRRHFHIEFMMRVFPAYLREPDPAARAAAFARFREIVASCYTDRIAEAYAPQGRVLVHLIASDREGDFSAYLQALAEAGGPPDVVTEDGRVLVALPWFRDPAHGLPDALFDITSQLKVECRIGPLDVGPTGIGFPATCRLSALSDRITGVSLVARPRHGSGDAVLPLAFEVMFDEINPYARVRDEVPLEWLFALPKGEVHDLHLRVCAGDTTRDRKAAECALILRPRVLRGAGKASGMRGVLTMTPRSYLSFCATGRAGLIARLLEHYARTGAWMLRERMMRSMRR